MKVNPKQVESRLKEFLKVETMWELDLETTAVFQRRDNAVSFSLHWHSLLSLLPLHISCCRPLFHVFFSLFEKVFLFYCFQNASLIAILTIKALTMLLLYTGRSCSKCLFQFVLIRFAVFVFVLSPFSVSSPSLRERDGEALVSRRIRRCDVPQKRGGGCLFVSTSPRAVKAIKGGSEIKVNLSRRIAAWRGAPPRRLL